MDYVEFTPIKGYEVIKDNLGSGSFGKTILIRDPSIDEIFVCKKYNPQTGLKKSEFFDTFKREIKLMYKINHPNVVRVYNYYLYDSAFIGYIIMEYIDGESIEQWFKKYLLKEKSSNEIFRQLIEAFNCIEKSGIIHRDIRESNILVSNDEEVKIIDFGLGKNLNDKKLSTDSFNRLINRRQMVKFPNEFSEGKYTSKTDMFCIAEMFERLLKKYKINDFKHEYILQKMLNPDPYKRYSCFNEILISLDRKEFLQLNISNDDKRIYNLFISSVMNCISTFVGKTEIEENLTTFLNGLKCNLEANCFNYHIENIPNLLNVFIKGQYRYYKQREIEVKTVQDFYDWLIDKEENYQNIVMKNIVNRLSSIEVKYEDDLPF